MHVAERTANLYHTHLIIVVIVTGVIVQWRELDAAKKTLARVEADESAAADLVRMMQHACIDCNPGCVGMQLTSCDITDLVRSALGLEPVNGSTLGVSPQGNMCGHGQTMANAYSDCNWAVYMLVEQKRLMTVQMHMHARCKASLSG